MYLVEILATIGQQKADIATGKIDRCRQNTLAEIFAYLQNILTRYQGDIQICQHGLQCDGMILGSLIIGMNAVNVLQSFFSPYNGFSVQDFFQKLRSMQVPQHCACNAVQRDSYPRPDLCEGVKRPLSTKLEELEKQIQGLDLMD